MRLPLSDCAFKYISAIWHHPAGRSTRLISRRYPFHYDNQMKSVSNSSGKEERAHRVLKNNACSQGIKCSPTNCDRTSLASEKTQDNKDINLGIAYSSVVDATGYHSTMDEIKMVISIWNPSRRDISNGNSHTGAVVTHESLRSHWLRYRLVGRSSASGIMSGLTSIA